MKIYIDEVQREDFRVSTEGHPLTVEVYRGREIWPKEEISYRMKLELPEYDYGLSIRAKGNSFEHYRTSNYGGMRVPSLSVGPIPEEIKYLLIKGFRSLPEDLQRDFKWKLSSRINWY